MLQHVHSDDCGTATIEFNGDWDVFEAGVYRYGECSICGQEVREYYAYRELEAITGDEETVVLHQR